MLLRLDSGFDAIENIAVVTAHNERHGDRAPAHDIIKWNPRPKHPEQWRAYADAHAEWVEPRPGKRVAVFDVHTIREHDGDDYPLRRVMRAARPNVGFAIVAGIA